jgi:hypothetical protein
MEPFPEIQALSTVRNPMRLHPVTPAASLDMITGFLNPVS